MLKLYIKIAIRNLLKNKLVSSVNILGLALGLFCTLFAIAYAIHEFSYERMHNNRDHVALVYLNSAMQGLEKLPVTCGPEGPRLKNEYPEIQDFVRSRNVDKVVVKFEDLLFLENDITVADPAYFDFFTFDFISGTTPKDPFDLVISKSLAIKYFNSTQVLGKVINIRPYDKAFDMKITGVFEDLPSNTHLRSSMIIPFSFAKNLHWKYERYNNTAYSTYVWHSSDLDLNQFNAKLKSTFDISQIQIEDVSAKLTPISDIHLQGDFTGSNYARLLIFLVASLMVLLVSCFNYINLTTATMAERTKEIGIKKVIGANKIRLITQFISEAGVVTMMAFALSFIALELSLPVINSFLERSISVNFLNPEILISVLILLGGTIALAGAYPAFYLSGINPTNLFNKNLQPTIFRKTGFRKSMIVAQFIFALLFIQSITILNRQFYHLENEDVIGFNSDRVLSLSGYPWGELEKIENVLQDESSIEQIAMASALPGSGLSLTSEWKTEDNREQAMQLTVSYAYADLFHIKMKSGRFFSKDFTTDTEDAVVINQEMADALELSDPVGEVFYCQGKMRIIIGVIDDYMATPPIFNSFPMIMRLQTWGNNHLLIRYKPGQNAEAQAAIQAGLSTLNPGYPVDIGDIDDEYAEDAKDFIKAADIFFFITIIAIANVIVGLFGLSIFMADKRKKEIGIRKTFGASVYSLMRLMFGNFLLMFFIAFAVASPVSYFLGVQFLKIFSRKVSLSADLFLLTGIWAILIILISVGWKLYLSANKNPVDTLRYE